MIVKQFYHYCLLTLHYSQLLTLMNNHLRLFSTFFVQFSFDYSLPIRCDITRLRLQTKVFLTNYILLVTTTLCIYNMIALLHTIYICIQKVNIQKLLHSCHFSQIQNVALCCMLQSREKLFFNVKQQNTCVAKVSSFYLAYVWCLFIYENAGYIHMLIWISFCLSIYSV